MTKPLISVLIPIYNGGDFLKRNISSLQAQTLKDFEIICIDDGSTDGSFEFLIDAGKTDERIKVIKRETKGGNAAKGITYGLPYCSGEWFFYSSQDDLFSTDCLEKCYKRVMETGADICIPDTVLFLDNALQRDEIIYAPNRDYNQIMAGSEAFFQSIVYRISGFALRRRELIDRIGYDDKYYDSCDKSSAFQYFFANKVTFCDAKFFYRQNNPNAITKSFSINTLHHLDTCNEVIEFSLKNKVKRSNIKNMVEVFIQRRIDLTIKALKLNANDRKTAILLLNKSLSKLKKLLLKGGLLSLYIKLLFIKFNKKIRRLYILNFLKDRSWTNNYYYRRTERRLRKYGVIEPEKIELYNAKVASALRLPCSVGRCTYAGDNIYVASPKTTIGSFCSLAANIFIGPGEHPTNYLSSSPFFYLDCLGYSISQGNKIFCEPCHIGNDVWICDNVFIKSGVTIGDGAVVGAGAVVVKDVPPYAIVGGVPAKVIRYRFDETIIAELLELKWWDLPDDVIKQISYDDVNEAVKFIKKVREREDEKGGGEGSD